MTEFRDLLSQMLDERGMSRDEFIEQLVAGFPEGPLASPGYGYSREHVYRAIEGAEELEAWLVEAIAQVLELDREKIRNLAEAYRNDLCAEVEAEPRQRQVQEMRAGAPDGAAAPFSCRVQNQIRKR